MAKPTAPTTANTKPTSWANFSGGNGLPLGDGTEPGRDERGEHAAVGVPARAADRADANTTACRPSRTAAATVLNAETTRVATMTAGGDPRGEARSADVDLIWSGGLVRHGILLLLSRDWAWACQSGCSEGDARCAQLLSSYDNNNSNNPRRGTDRLRGAW